MHKILSFSLERVTSLNRKTTNPNTHDVSEPNDVVSFFKQNLKKNIPPDFYELIMNLVTKLCDFGVLVYFHGSSLYGNFNDIDLLVMTREEH